MELNDGYAQSAVGLIPRDWACKPLADFLGFISYGFTNPMPTVSDGVYMITAADIDQGKLQLASARKTSIASFQKLLTAKSKPRTNDILLTKDGSLGRLALVGDEVICINQSVAVLRPNEKVEPNFLKLLLESPWYQTRMLDDAGGSTIKHIYITIVDKMPIGLPLDKKEQRAIATALSDVDALIAGLEKLIAKKRDLKQAAMQQLLTGQTRLPGFSGEWVSRSLGSLGVIYGGLVGKSKADFGHGSASYVPFVNVMANIRIDCGALEPVNVVSTENQNRVLCGDLLFNGSSETPEEVALCALMTQTVEDLYLNSFCFGFRFKQGVEASGLFLTYLMRSQMGRELMKSLAQGSTRYNLSKSALLQARLVLPNLEEQTAIATVLSDMDADLSALEARLAKTRDLKQGMMQELLTGRTRLV